MKKLLLIIAVTLLIFQMVVLAISIDIGSTAEDRDYETGTNTYVDKNNPANASGKITSVEIYAVTGGNLTNCKVATFYVESGNNLSTRDYETVDNGNGAGVVIAGSKQTFTVDLDVEVGDYIGIFFTGTPGIEIDLFGDGVWISGGFDWIPADNNAFEFYADRTISLSGTGTTEVGITWNGVDITKWNGVDITIPINTQ